MKNAATSTEKLIKELATLNKKHIALDKKLYTVTCENESYKIGEQMEAINERMCEIGSLLENS